MNFQLSLDLTPLLVVAIARLWRPRRLAAAPSIPHVGAGEKRMKLPTKTEADLAEFIRGRAIEIAAGEGETIDIRAPAIQRLREPTGIFGIHWSLADWQEREGLPYIQVAAAEASAQWELASEE